MIADSPENTVLETELNNQKKMSPTQRKVSERYELLRRLKKPDEKQLQFVMLHEKITRTASEEEAYQLAVKHQLKILADEDATLAANNSVKTSKEQRKAEDHKKVLYGVLLINFLETYPEFRQQFAEHADVYFVDKKAERKIIEF
jgi:hypothetical protein